MSSVNRRICGMYPFLFRNHIILCQAQISCKSLLFYDNIPFLPFHFFHRLKNKNVLYQKLDTTTIQNSDSILKINQLPKIIAGLCFNLHSWISCSSRRYQNGCPILMLLLTLREISYEISRQQLDSCVTPEECHFILTSPIHFLRQNRKTNCE